METLYAELNKRAKAATNRYSATGDFLQYIYSVCACDYESSEHPIEVFMNFRHRYFLTVLFIVAEKLY